jgi:4-hydroxy-4-methyl-2-oxoglutarate aldolase
MHVHPDPDWIIELTPKWSGERYPSGRPRVATAVLDRIRTATTEQAWSVLRSHGYDRQFAGGWMETRPGAIVVGRAVTSVFLPHRPDFDEAIVAAGAREGNLAADRQNSWIIETLVEGDVMVTDIFGKVENGTVIGDNLGTAIAARTRVGAVIDGGVRDMSGLAQLDGINFFCRGADPTAIQDVTLAGINVPIRIGAATVLPGDVVLGTPTGVMFIPAHLAEEVAEAAEDVAVRDVFGKLRLTERTYSSAEIDVPVWPEHIESDFQRWRQDQPAAGAGRIDDGGP